MMKQYLIILFLIAAPIFAAAQTTLSDLELKDGLYYKKGSEEPYTGRCVEWHPNQRRKSDAQLKNGQLVGTFESYDPFGNLIGEAKYKNGQRNGWEIHYYPSGQLMRKGKYSDDKLEGDVTTWDEEGNILKVDHFKDGRKTGSTGYKDGKPIE